MNTAQFRFPTDIRFGAGISDSVGREIARRKLTRPLIVTDKGLADHQVCQDLIDLLRREHLNPSVYSEASGNPDEAHVTHGVAAYRAHQADCLVLLGGGCAVDVGKAIGLLINHEGPLFDYEDGKADAPPIDREIPLMIALPTTAGTGSEVGGSSVISDPKTHRKVIIWSPRLIPNIVFADPALTVALPPAVTAATGIDALTHNIEAYLARGYHPICDGIALEGMRLAWHNLERATLEGGNLEARGAMLMSSMMGAIAFQKGLGVTHSCAHALSTVFDTHHGLANAVMLPSALRYNLEVVPERFAAMERHLGLAEGSFFDECAALIARIGLPNSPAAVGAELTDELIEIAVNDVCHSNNPRPCDRSAFQRIFAAAFAMQSESESSAQQAQG